jgi:hypothetical protein
MLTPLRWVFALGLSGLPLLVAWLAGRFATRLYGLRKARVFGFFAIAVPFGALTAFASAWTRSFLELDPRLIEHARPLLGFHILLEAPVLETVKALLIWRAYRRGLFSSPRVGALHAALVGAGFSLGELALELFRPSHPLAFPDARLAFLVPGHVFFSMGWAVLLHRGGRDRFFGFVWLLLTAFHGFYRDVALERPPGFLALLVPLLLLMALSAWFFLVRLRGAATVSERLETDGPQALLEAFRPRRRQSSVLWIALGSLVTLGVTLSFLALSVFVGNRLGADFSLLDEGSLTRFGPLSLLGLALLAAFPFSAFLVARASAARSVVEPAWSTAGAVILVLVLFSVSEPSAVIVAVALAPVAFVLGCLGAWAGLDAPD